MSEFSGLGVLLQRTSWRQLVRCLQTRRPEEKGDQENIRWKIKCFIRSRRRNSSKNDPKEIRLGLKQIQIYRVVFLKNQNQIKHCLIQQFCSLVYSNSTPKCPKLETAQMPLCGRTDKQTTAHPYEGYYSTIKRGVWYTQQLGGVSKELYQAKEASLKRLQHSRKEKPTGRRTDQ